jgi:hypothetical protein
MKEVAVSLLVEYGFDVKQGRGHDFQAWLSENETKFADACPAGVEYVGTFGVVFASEKHAGGSRQLFRLANYGAMDALSAALKEGGTYASLFNEMFEFVDTDKGTDWSNGLYRSMTDIGMPASA